MAFLYARRCMSLYNADEVEPYVERHKEILRKSNPSKNGNLISEEHNQFFIKLKWLANDPSIHVLSYTSYLINEFTFYTEKQDDQS
ncbi:hypothetical protein Lal_00012016 [Lupinus albus]|nr:hypothetical protein Lal_00012016 [Lupinus albus]